MVTGVLLMAQAGSLGFGSSAARIGEDWFPAGAGRLSGAAWRWPLAPTPSSNGRVVPSRARGGISDELGVVFAPTASDPLRTSGVFRWVSHRLR
jgi:hypothetical protein